MALHQFVYTEDTIDFCIKNENKEEAMKGIRKVYSPESDEMHQQIY